MSTVEDRIGSAGALDEIAAQFPTLMNRSFGGRPVVYLDSSATSQTPQAVIDAMTHYYTHTRASIHRGIYPLAAEATDLYEGARGRIAEWLGSTPEETIFTANTTAAINLVAYTWGRQNVQRGDLVVVTEMEHHSNIVPWQLLCQDREAELAYVPVSDDGHLDLAALDSLLERGPKLVAVVHVSNVLGTINPVAEITQRAHAAGATVLVDGSQAIPQLPVWLPDLDEAGTSQIAEAIGLGVAVDWMRSLGMDAIRAHEQTLVEDALERLLSSEVPGLSIQGPLAAADRGSLVSFTLEGAHPHDIADILGHQGVCVRAGHHCAQPLMRRLGVPATTRASFAVHNSKADVQRLIEGLDQVRSTLQLG
jgi:cysteine desulfurase/selenocysteine lyase